MFCELIILDCPSCIFRFKTETFRKLFLLLSSGLGPSVKLASLKAKLAQKIYLFKNRRVKFNRMVSHQTQKVFNYYFIIIFVHNLYGSLNFILEFIMGVIEYCIWAELYVACKV